MAREQLADALGRDHQHLPAFQHHRGQDRPLAAEQAQLAQKAARAVDPDQMLLAAVPADDRDPAVQDHHEVVPFLALVIEDLALARRPALAVGGDRRQLPPAQARVLPIAVRCLVACHRVGCVHDHHLHRGACHHPAPPGRPQGGHDPDRDGAVRGRPGAAPTLATTMSPLVLDGYPAVMRQTIRSEIFRAAPTAG